MMVVAKLRAHLLAVYLLVHPSAVLVAVFMIV